ncbi:MAG: (Fe-S)-binding protein [Planctomycetota bacterium]
MNTVPGTGHEIALFIPCYIDQLFPQVGEATLDLLEGLGCSVHYDPRQTCCGQPQSNSGCAADAAVLARRHLDIFRGRTTVCPSGSCVSMVRHHYRELGLQLSDQDLQTMADTHELADFLTGVLGVEDVHARFPHRVVLHQSCHGLRELGQGPMSERRDRQEPGPVEHLLRSVRDLELVFPERRDECCGFGGTFAVNEPALSARMGRDRLDQFAATEADFVCAGDMSCLMHLDGLRRKGHPGPPPKHIAEILVSR